MDATSPLLDLEALQGRNHKPSTASSMCHGEQGYSAPLLPCNIDESEKFFNLGGVLHSVI